MTCRVPVLLLALATLLPPIADGAPPAITHHEGTFHGTRLRYTATVDETVIPETAGTPAARIVSIAYTADRADAARRPVLFACNGGPIASSWLLHMLALGPRRLAIPDDLRADRSAFRVVDNPYTVLDVADVVFYDPAGTGWSRAQDSTRIESFYSVEADAREFATFVAEWSRQHGRTASPKYLLGESYATMRVAESAAMLARRPDSVLVDGVFLMGQAVNQLEIMTRPYNILSYVTGLPSITATAWYHDRIPRAGRSVLEAMDEAFRFGREEYLRALYQGANLPDSTRTRIAARLESLTGLPAHYFIRHALRVSRPRFAAELFHADSLKVGLDDSRYVGPASGPSPDGVAVQAAYDSLLHYLRTDLAVTRSQEYRQFHPAPTHDSLLTRSAAGGNPGAGWIYGPGTPNPFADFPYAASLGEMFERNPRFRLVVGSGIYDLKTTTGAAEYLLAQTGWPRDRTRLTRYEGGHMAYTNEAALAAFTADLRALLTGR